MTVQELIDKLSEVQDKSLTVWLFVDNGYVTAQGKVSFVEGPVGNEVTIYA